MRPIRVFNAGRKRIRSGCASETEVRSLERSYRLSDCFDVSSLLRQVQHRAPHALRQGISLIAVPLPSVHLLEGRPRR